MAHPNTEKPDQSEQPTPRPTPSEAQQDRQKSFFSPANALSKKYPLSRGAHNDHEYYLPVPLQSDYNERQQRAMNGTGPALNERFNYRLNGPVTSNESFPQIRLVTQISSGYAFSLTSPPGNATIECRPYLELIRPPTIGIYPSDTETVTDDESSKTFIRWSVAGPNRIENGVAPDLFGETYRTAEFWHEEGFENRRKSKYGLRANDCAPQTPILMVETETIWPTEPGVNNETRVIRAVAFTPGGKPGQSTETNPRLESVAATNHSYRTVYLLPVDITVRKKSEADAPPTGLVVKKGEVVTFDINGPAPASDFPLPANNVKWKTKQLKSDGTYTGWTDVPGEGPELDFTTNISGIFQAKAVLTVAGGQPQDLPLVRKKDELKTSNGYMGPGRKGQPDAFGVCDTQKQVDIQGEAKRYLGSPAYAATTPVAAEYGFGAYPASGNSIIRCNIFVAHRCCAVGATVPPINFGLGITTGNPGLNAYPPRANQWAGIETTAPFTIGTTYIAAWDFLATSTYPQPGFIIAHPQPGDAGHCAIIDYDGGGIGAGTSGTVNKNYPDFYDGTSRFRFYQP